MTWIEVIDEKSAKGDLLKVYKYIKEKRGKISNIMRVHSLNPSAMQKHLDLYVTLMFGASGLSREERELIGVVVSNLNGCDYCVRHHATALNHYWKNEEKIVTLLSDFKAVDLSDRQRKMLVYVHKLTLSPGETFRQDVQVLQEIGFTDEDILNISLITSYFCFVNRIVLGLGIESTADESRGYKY
ncbi:peroxidase [candidate division WOR_3 bacterium SM1_77]|jgi:uncharacterized peroxidase-related enzyme|uniref:Peroxidase n=1 Tax=candidate division WOR_3 bacterium SM1_77 TaxID=1703778 RepID=A0A0S8JXU9_UNCW3|nr:MAG: peroxidase [candidate division WOR_3 bacterium SM1_77]